MHPILQAVLSLVAAVGLLVGFLEYAKRSGRSTQSFSYARIAFLTAVVICFGLLFYYLSGFVKPTPKPEARVALSAVLCWLPFFGIALLVRKTSKKRC